MAEAVTEERANTGRGGGEREEVGIIKGIVLGKWLEGAGIQAFGEHVLLLDYHTYLKSSEHVLAELGPRPLIHGSSRSSS